MFIAEPPASQEDRSLAGVAHLLVFAQLIGAVIAVVIWSQVRKRSPGAAFQAAQAAVYQFTLFALSTILGFCVFIPLMLIIFPITVAWSSDSDGALASFAFFAVFWVLILVMIVVTLAAYGYAVYAAVQTFRGHDFRYVVIGDLTARLFPSSSSTATDDERL